MTHSLAISLGHNSSAVLIRDGQIVAGYEEERFTGLKADSRFPVNSIEELKTRYGLPKETDVYVGHWFIDAHLPDKNKYWDPDYIRGAFPNGEIMSLSPDFTHHDSHLESAMVFAGDGAWPQDYHAVVADGFGSFGECISVYHVVGRKYSLLKRVFGFEKSLGMLYQYATAFMGMKMHNHEYKMLAYEVHATEVLQPWEMEILQGLAKGTSGNYLKAMHELKVTSAFDPVTKIDALPAIQASIDRMLTEVLVALDRVNAPEYERRVIISHFVQKVVELTMVTFVKLYKPHNLLLVGGLFYNVKLNHLLDNAISGRTCIMPLAGDQGAALGVYQAYKGDLQWPGHLSWGDRDLAFDPKDLPKGVVLVENDDEAAEVISEELGIKGFCNLVRGKMEYGPRALCNTSTIAIPSKEVAARVNAMNARTMEMPFAPVVTQSQAESLFEGIGSVHRSLEYMIVTRMYRSGQGEKFPGAAHYYPEEGVFTGRPQITSEPMMVGLLEQYGPLVNTSFNFHGVPIVRSEDQILNTHCMEWQTSPELEPTTVIVRNQA